MNLVRKTPVRILLPMLLAALPLHGQEKAAAKADKPKAEASKSAAKKPSEEEMMRAWQAYATPGDPHKVLVKGAGSWTTKTKSWMDPKKPQPEESDGTSEVSSMLGDRYISEKFTGKMTGQPFEGFGVTGYDNKLKQYQTFWVDSMGTGMLMMKGPADKSGKVITQTGTMVDPSSANGSVKVKGVTTLEDDDHRRFEMWMTGPDGKQFKTLEVSYARKR